MNKFLENLTNNNDKLLARRAESVNTRAKMTYENLISNIKLEIETKKLKYQDLTDMGPETSTSLTPASPEWNPQEWVNKIHKIKTEIYDLTVQLKLALEVYAELFSDENGGKKDVAQD